MHEQIVEILVGWTSCLLITDKLKTRNLPTPSADSQSYGDVETSLLRKHSSLLVFLDTSDTAGTS